MPGNLRATLIAFFLSPVALASAAELRPFQLPSSKQGYVVPMPQTRETSERPVSGNRRSGKEVETDAAESNVEPVIETWKSRVDERGREFDSLLKSLD